MERHSEQRQGRGSQQGRESTPQTTCGKQEALARSEVTERGGGSEADEADDERALAADVVGYPAPEEQQTAEGERVRRDDPLLVGIADLEEAFALGSARFTREASSTTISWAIAMTPRARHRRFTATLYAGGSGSPRAAGTRLRFVRRWRSG